MTVRACSREVDPAVIVPFRLCAHQEMQTHDRFATECRDGGHRGTLPLPATVAHRNRMGVQMPQRSLIAFALLVATTLAVTAREPVVIKTKATADKDQSRIVSDPSLKPQKFSDFVASEAP
jgi:hypothetical protein